MAALPYALAEDLHAANINSTRLLRDYLANKAEADALYMDTFVKRSSIMTVYLSNKLEQTFVGTAAPAAIHATLEKIYDEQAVGIAAPDTASAIAATGGRPDLEELRMRQQLWQHVAALKYWCFQCAPGSKPFTVDMLLRTHHLLMEGLSDDDGKAVTAGAFRTTPCHSGTGFIYSKAQNIRAEVQSAVDNFNAALTTQHPVQAAADLFYAIITTHPFQDGNGRLCRLLASYAFMCAGVPFPARCATATSEAPCTS
ncbi:fido domain-containing protein [Tribonema minus]|uniref:Fido domain-containing protein n=1 Tax=Tribonema minus TaxID=303371 RepID=A0A836CN97_9STRA|nr:fido domain-containing protein [Tribonema minus]